VATYAENKHGNGSLPHTNSSATARGYDEGGGDRGGREGQRRGEDISSNNTTLEEDRKSQNRREPNGEENGSEDRDETGKDEGVVKKQADVRPKKDDVSRRRVGSVDEPSARSEESGEEDGATWVCRNMKKRQEQRRRKLMEEQQAPISPSNSSSNRAAQPAQTSSPVPRIQLTPPSQPDAAVSLPLIPYLPATSSFDHDQPGGQGQASGADAETQADYNGKDQVNAANSHHVVDMGAGEEDEDKMNEEGGKRQSPDSNNNNGSATSNKDNVNGIAPTPPARKKKASREKEIENEDIQQRDEGGDSVTQKQQQNQQQESKRQQQQQQQKQQPQRKVSVEHPAVGRVRRISRELSSDDDAHFGAPTRQYSKQPRSPLSPSSLSPPQLQLLPQQQQQQQQQPLSPTSPLPRQPPLSPQQDTMKPEHPVLAVVRRISRDLSSDDDAHFNTAEQRPSKQEHPLSPQPASEERAKKTKLQHPALAQVKRISRDLSSSDDAHFPSPDQPLSPRHVLHVQAQEPLRRISLNSPEHRRKYLQVNVPASPNTQQREKRRVSIALPTGEIVTSTGEG
jgi:hypothetical protein